MQVVVIGAGIVGVSAALSLAERGAQVVVLERGSVAGEASGLNAGLIGGGGWGDRPTLDVALKMGSRDLFVDLSQVRGHDIGLDLSGTLTLIRTAQEWEWARTICAQDHREGRGSELVAASDLVELEPEVDPNLLGAIFDPFGARAEPVMATRAFASEAVSAGVTIQTGCEVTGLRPLTGGGWEVVVGDQGEVFGADVVVVAAGPWSAAVASLAGVEVPVVAVRGQMWASAPQARTLRHGISAAESPVQWGDEASLSGTPPELTHRGDRRMTRHLYGRQRPNGELVFGGDRVLSPDRTVDSGGIVVNHNHVAELLPIVAGLPVVRTWAGLMPFSLDGQPLLGPIPDRAGLFLATGLASSGFGRGPMAGQLVADLVLEHPPTVDMTEVLPTGRVGH